MKNIIPILFVVFTFNIINGQVNRHTELTPSRFTPISAPNLSQGNSEAIAIQKFREIHNSIEYYSSKIDSNLKTISDPDFIYKMKVIQSDINFLLSTEMSLNSAVSFMNNISKKYNRAVKEYNKRVKKHNKALKKAQKKKDKESRKKQNKNNKKKKPS